MALSPGDTLKLQDGSGWQSVRLTGVYQDITNGGRTAKAAGGLSCGNPIWVTVNLDAAPGGAPEQIIADFKTAFEGLRAYSMSDYSAQTLGPTLASLGVAVRASLIVSTVVVALIAALFTGVLLTRDAGPNAVLRALGAPGALVRNQYLVRLLALLSAGVVIGAVLAGTAGEAVTGALMSILGAPRISFCANPLISYLACPAALILAVAAATAAAGQGGAKPRAHTALRTD
ncbi:MAG: hypothetical protein LBI84_04655 [Propionibacteriaceae bacterium]|nr:hypothetical protein [Propionibacteriaceae bacterium]